MSKPFGWEYAWRPSWGSFHRIFIRIFGMVDLPGRIRARSVLLAAAEAPPGDAIDLGSGTGVYAHFLTRVPGKGVVAIDIDPQRILEIEHVARRLGRDGLRTVCGGDPALDGLARGGFGLVLAVEVLQYLPDLPSGLERIRDRLKPGGLLVAHVPIRAALWPHERTLFDDDRLRNLLRDAGFETIELRRTFGKWARELCRMFTWCVGRPPVLALAYPLLLAASGLLPRFDVDGEYRLIVAGRGADGGVSK